MTAFSEAAVRVAAGADHRDEAATLVAAMSLDEKLGCLDGDVPAWPGLVEMMGGGYNTRTWPAAHVERMGVPGLDFVDGPRGCVVGPATTFPVPMARGASFDPDLEERIGRAIGAELRATGATYTGAVCMNLLRHPAWGRAQETYGEDPHHVGEMAAALTRGLQEHVMACMKHFALNSMENARFTVDVTADDRALHEVYLPHFKRVADEGVASVMSAYNSVNGEWCGENHELLTSILRDDWGWDGFVITDFINGLRDPVKSVQAGCNVEMPFAQQRAEHLSDAIARGELDVADVDARVIETVATFLRFARVYEQQPDEAVIASAEHRELAREAASASMVLLHNDGLLPVDPSAVTTVAVLGELAAVPNLGDGGSSNVHFTPDPVTPLAGIEAGFPNAVVRHSDDDASIAADADLCVVVVGLTRDDEGEYIGAGMNETLMTLMPALDHPTLGFADEGAAAQFGQLFEESDGVAGGLMASGGDRDSLRLPAHHEALIEAAAAVSDRVVVVMIAGSALVVPWMESVNAALMAWYAGSEAGHAIFDVLSGRREPGGRLPFTVPVDESDLVPFDKEATTFTYDLLHGQWFLDDTGTAAHLPFGFGLGYTSFELAGATADGDTVAVTVTNTGSRTGSTVVQVYGSVPESAHIRPAKRLVGFAKVTLDAGASSSISIPLDRTMLHVRVDGAWVDEDAPVQLHVGLDAYSSSPV